MVDFYRMRQLMKQVPRQLANYQRIMSQAIGGTAQLSDMPRASGYSADRIVNAVISMEETCQAYYEVISELQGMRKQLKPYIDRLDDANDKAAMRLRYLSGYSLDQIAQAPGIAMDRSTVWRRLQKSEKTINCMR